MNLFTSICDIWVGAHHHVSNFLYAYFRRISRNWLQLEWKGCTTFTERTVGGKMWGACCIIWGNLCILWLRSACVAVLPVVFSSFFYNGHTRFCFLFFFFRIEYITTCSPYIFSILFILLNQQDYCIFLLFSNLLHSAFALAFFGQFFFSFLGKSLVSWDLGMLDLLFILQWNLVLGIPDCFSVIMEECVSGILGRIQWMLIIVNIPKLWTLGIQWMLIIVVIPKLCHLLLYL